MSNSSDNLKHYVPLLVIAAAVLLIQILLSFMSSFYAWEDSNPVVLIPWTVVIMVLAGVAFLFVLKLEVIPCGRRTLFLVVTAGLLMRLANIPSTPILEDDVYRYLWDGAVTASGHNPYAWVPEDVLHEELYVPDDLKVLGREGRSTLEKVNHPHLRTVYPAAAQAVFAVAHFIKPFSITAWRFVLLLFDLAAMILLIRWLKGSRAGPMGLLLYWWNPLLIHEVYNTNHVDVVMIPLLFGMILATKKQRWFTASGLLALAAGVKIWPLLLVPILLRPLISQPKKLAGCLAFIGGLMSLQFLPVFMAGISSDLGFVAYGKGWEMNDGLYMVFFWVVQGLGGLVDLDRDSAHLFTRYFVGGVLVMLIGALSRRSWMEKGDLVRRCLWAVFALFMLSPTQFPWYFLWVLPFLVMQPRFSMLLLVPLLSLYYLRFYFDEIGHVGVFDYGLVWLQFLPVLVLLVIEFRRRPVG